jgi:hypothetical protein
MDRNAYRDENDTGQPDAYQPDAYQAAAGPASGVEPGGGCAPNAIVLSLFTSMGH